MDRSVVAVRRHLALARSYGVPFAVAWPAAFDLGLALASDDELPDLFDALTSTWAAWLAAYERSPGLLADLAPPLSRPC